MFSRVVLCKNLGKMAGIVCQTCHIIGKYSDTAYTRRMMSFR